MAPERSFVVLTSGQLGVLFLTEAFIRPEVNQFSFGEFMWRYVAAKRFACSQRPGVN